MKRYPFLLLIALFFLPSLACGVFSMNTTNGSGNIITQTVDVSDFDSVSLEGSGEVHIEQGQTESLTIEGDDNILPLLDTRVRGNQLVLSTKPNLGINPSQPIVYRVTVKDLTGLSLDGSGKYFVSPVSSDSMDISLMGSGDIRLDELTTGKLATELDGSGNILIDDLTATAVDASVNGSGDIELSGKADSQNVSFDGSGNYLAGNLETSTANMDVSGSADLIVWVTEQLTARVDGSANIQYYGNQSITNSGSGSIKIKYLGNK
jgi:hypothetical protein